MALMPCAECAQQVSDTAETCPHCGVRIAPAKAGCGKVVLYLVLAVVAAFVFLIVVTAMSGSRSGLPRVDDQPLGTVDWDGWDMERDPTLDQLDKVLLTHGAEAVLKNRRDCRKIVYGAKSDRGPKMYFVSCLGVNGAPFTVRFDDKMNIR